MRLFLILLFCFGTSFLFSQNKKVLNEFKKEYSFNKNIKIEDENGHIITDSIKRIDYLVKRQQRIDFNTSQNYKNPASLIPVPLCTNGSFEQFETISSTNVLTNFQHIDAELLNPIQCKSPSVVANENIIEYNPNNFDIMATTVPSNFLDEYIGNINAFDQFALKINYKNSNPTVSLIQSKRFKTDNELSLKFNYKAVLQSILGDDHLDEQPFFKARILNISGQVVSEFCLIADPNNCIFTQASVLEGDSVVMYTQNWQSGILDISSIPNNEVFTVEFFASRCGLGGHFGYAFIDDICLLHTNENLQGSVDLDPLYKICPTLPMTICGSFTIPNSGGVNATIDSVTLNIYNETNTVIFTSQIPSTLDLTTKRFCFSVLATDLPNILTGTYNTSVTINYGIIQTDCSGTNFGVVTDYDANPSWDIWFLNCANCDIDLHTASLTLCDTNHNGKEFFNLSNINSLISVTQTGLTFSYYATLANATSDTNAIANFTNFESPSASIFVRVTLNATCYKIIAINLIVKYPVATVSGILNVCSGSTLLTASSGASYHWGNNEVTQSITVNSTGTYTVTVTDNFGCVATGSATILNSQVAVLPTIVVTQPTCFISTGTIEVTSPASEFSFDDGVTWVTTSILNNVAVGNYKVKIKTISGCYSYSSNIVIIPFLSSFPFYSSVSPTFCGGIGSITITSLASFYSFDDGVTWSTDPVLNNLPSGIYLIRTKDTNGCISNFNSVSLNSEFLDAPLYIKDNPYCGILGKITITTPASQYSFDGGTTWQSSNESINLIAGSYIIKIKDIRGCTSPNVYVYLNNLESSYPDYILTNAGCGVYASITITTHGDSYSFDNGATWTTNPVALNLTSGTSYQLKVRKGLNCRSYTAYVYIYSYYYPIPVANNYETTYCDDLNDGSENVDLTVYNTNIITNHLNYTFTYFNSYLGAENNDYSNQINNFTSCNLSNSNNKVYVRVTSVNYCHKVVELSFVFINSPVIVMKDEFPLCEFKNVLINAGNGFDSYLWSTGETSQIISITQPGNYWVIVTENHGSLVCDSTKNFTVFLSNPATISKIITTDWTDYYNTLTVLLSDSSIGNYEYSIDGVNYQDNASFTGLESGIYEAFVRDKNECGIVNQDVSLLMFPKFFTPNDDDFNDTWKIKFSNKEIGMTVKIFDRNGKFIKEIFHNTSWDGTYHNKPLPSSDYWFVITRANGKQYREHFTLKR